MTPQLAKFVWLKFLWFHHNEARDNIPIIVLPMRYDAVKRADEELNSVILRTNKGFNHSAMSLLVKRRFGRFYFIVFNGKCATK